MAVLLAGLLLLTAAAGNGTGLVPWTVPWGTVGPPPPRDRKLLMAQHRLDLLRRHADGSAWWAQPAALAEVRRQLSKDSFVLVDGFQGSEAAGALREVVVGLRRAGALGGSRVLGHAAASHPAKSAKASFLRGDEIAWVPVPGRGRHPHPAGSQSAVAKLVRLLDELVSLLASGDADHGSVELGDVTHRSDAMVTCYPHEARYVRHTDNSCRRGHGARCNGRRLTAIGYLNPPRPDGDGALRLYSGDGDVLTSAPRLDVQPDLDRVLLFYSDDRVPHEVLPTDEPRFAVTVWYYDSTEAPKGTLANLTCLETARE
jgi:hypoxia-inducible factor (prolyl hydroxylase)